MPKGRGELTVQEPFTAESAETAELQDFSASSAFDVRRTAHNLIRQGDFKAIADRMGGPAIVNANDPGVPVITS